MFCARLFICALWSPAGKGLTSWLSFVVSSVSLSLSHWYPGSGVVLDCIDSWSLQPYYFAIFLAEKLYYFGVLAVIWVSVYSVSSSQCVVWSVIIVFPGLTHMFYHVERIIYIFSLYNPFFFFQIKDYEMFISLCQKYLDKQGHRAFVTWLMFIRPCFLVVHPGPMKTVLTASATSMPKDKTWAGVYRMLSPWIGLWLSSYLQTYFKIRNFVFFILYL